MKTSWSVITIIINKFHHTVYITIKIFSRGFIIKFDYYFNCCLFLLKLNQIDKGEQAFKKALELNKFHAPAANQLGILAFNKKDFITAQKYFYQAYISDKSNQGYKNNLEVVKKILQK